MKPVRSLLALPAGILLMLALIVLGVVSLAIILVMLLISFTVLERFPATVSTGNLWNPSCSAVWPEGQLSVWVYAPYLAPGAGTDVEVVVYGGLRVAINEIRGTFAGQPLSHKGGGATWGPTLVTKRKVGLAQDSLTFRLQVPPESPAGEDLNLELEVEHTLAVAEADGAYRNQPAKARVNVPIRVLSPAVAAFKRWGSAGWALLMFGLVVGLGYGLILASGDPPSRTDNGPKAQVLVGLGLVALVAYGFLGHLLFVLPLLHALCWPPGLSNYVLLGVWLLGPPVIIGRVVLWRDARDDEGLPLLRDSGPLERVERKSAAKSPPGQNPVDPLPGGDLP
jgi:hypothetical protein